MWIFQYRITADCSSHNYYCLDSNSVWDIRDCPHITAYNVVYCVRTLYCYAAVVSIQMEPPLVFWNYLQKKEVILMISTFVYLREAVLFCTVLQIHIHLIYAWGVLAQRKLSIVKHGLANLIVFSNLGKFQLSYHWNHANLIFIPKINFPTICYNSLLLRWIPSTCIACERQTLPAYG